MIELTYIEHSEEFGKDLSIKKHFKTWQSLDEFVISQKLEKYTVQGSSSAARNFASVIMGRIYGNIK
jgi:hypothetical protein